jgi:hypothetical protein
MACKEPIDFEALIAWWLGEPAPEREAALEDHLFDCAPCTAQLETLAALASGVRAAMRDGRMNVVVSAPFLEAMRHADLHVREYGLEPGGSVSCTIRADDDAVVSRLRAPLAGVRRLDLVSTQSGHSVETRALDVPFDAQTGEVLMIPSATWLRTLPVVTIRMRLIAVEESGERPVGDYTFNHSPS